MIINETYACFAIFLIVLILLTFVVLLAGKRLLSADKIISGVYMVTTKRLGRELKYKGKILDFCEDTLEMPDGHIAHYDFIDHRRAAAVVPVLSDGRIILVRQYRNSVDRDVLEIPSGGLNGWDEPTIKAAARELEEETGYYCDNLSPLLSIVTAIAFCNEIVDIYLASDIVESEKRSQHLDDDEYIDVEYYTLDEIKKMIYNGTIQDSKTISAIMLYADSIKP